MKSEMLLPRSLRIPVKQLVAMLDPVELARLHAKISLQGFCFALFISAEGQGMWFQDQSKALDWRDSTGIKVLALQAADPRLKFDP